MRRNLTYAGVVSFVIFAMIVLVVSRPQSSAGIKIVEHNTAQLSPGQKLVVHDLSKHRKYWTVTYNENGTVSDDCGVLCRKETKKLCGVGCTITLDTGMLIKSFKVTQNEDGTINVRWPDGYFRD